MNKYSIKEITNKQQWERFLLEQENTPFFQSWYWGEVQSLSGKPVLRFGLFENDQLVGIAQPILVQAKRGSFYWLRHGPLFHNKWHWPLFQLLLDTLSKHPYRKKTMFIRVAPLLADTTDNYNRLQQFGMKPAPIHNMDAEQAWVLDLQPTEDELLKNMRKTTRYLIRKAETMHVDVVQTTDMHYFPDFMDLYASTASRQHFVPHSGIPQEYEIFGEKNLLQLFLARYNNTFLAGAMILFYGKEAVYHHSGMKEDAKDIPASYAIQWKAIQEAKKRQMLRYNFWGVSPQNKPSHPWYGLSMFKRGFGGYEHTHIHAHDLPLSPTYWLTWGIESFRRIKKGY